MDEPVYEYRVVCPDGHYGGWRFSVFGEAVNLAARCAVAHGGPHPVERTVIAWEPVPVSQEQNT